MYFDASLIANNIELIKHSPNNNELLTKNKSKIVLLYIKGRKIKKFAIFLFRAVFESVQFNII